MIQIKRGETNLLQIEPSRSSVHIKAVMADDKVTLSWEQAFVAHLNLVDYIMHDGLRYKLNTLPTIKKLSTKLFQYDAIFEAPQYDLLKVAYMFLDGNVPEGEFTMTANADMFMDLLILNLQRVYPDGDWTKGQVIADSEYITLTFSFENCMSVLQRFASEFNTEYSFSGYTVNLKKVTTERLVTLQYKRTSAVVSGEEADAMADNANLYDIERLSVDSSNVITRLYPFGSSKNLSSDYRGGAARLTVPYIDSPKAAVFGIIEATKSFDDVFPRLELTGAGVITAIGADEFTFIDDAIDFDINDQMLDGVRPKVKFLTGECAGYECEIKSFNYGTYTYVIIPNTDDKDYKIPNATIRPAIGDKYVLLDIKMPEAYVDMAENELTAEGTKYLITDGNDSVKVSYRVRFSSIYAKLHPQALEVSDTVTVYDPDIAVNEPIRITRITRNMAVLSEVDIELSNSISVGTLDRITSDVSELKNTAVTTEVEIRKNSLAGYRNAKELREMVFDPDGYFDPDNIRPASIETGMLSVGTRSQSFQLTCSVNANTGANPQLFSWSAGALAHFTIADTIKIWTIPSGSITLTGGNTSVALYIYARCSRTTTDAVLYLDATAIKFDADAAYWYFLVGVLHSPISGVRGISLTYGQTIINGQFIQTGVIRSLDGLTYFDLNNGEIGGNIKFKSGQTPEDLEDDIDNLYDEIAGFGSDGIITPAEKRELKIQWDEIAYEFQPLYDQGDALSCASFEVYGDAYSALYSYLFANPNLLNPANMGIDSTIVPSAYKLVWANFFKFRAALRTEIAAAINALVDIVASDGVLTPAEKLQLKSMWDGMVADHGKVVRRATAAGITALTVYTTFVSKYNTLTDYLNPIFTNMSANSTIVPATFKTNFSDYATAKADVEKYLDEYDEQTVTTMIANIDKAISDSWITPAEQRTLRIQWDTIEGEIVLLYNQADNLGCAGTSNYYTAYTALKNYISSIGLFVNMSASVYIANVTTFRAYWISYYQNKEIIVTQINDKLGIKASAADYLRTAMQGSTDISGGLLLTNLLLMKSTAGAILGGMSGILADLVGMWTGGTYDQAQAGTANVILYKNGTAKIGIFKVYADRIEVDLPYGKLKFDGTGLYLLDANGNKKVEIYSGAIPTLASIVGEGSQLSVPAQSLNATFVNEHILTNFGGAFTLPLLTNFDGQFSHAVASNKITMNVNATIKFTFAGSNVELYWRLRNTGTNEIIMWGSPIIYTVAEINSTKNISLSASVYDKPAGTYQLELRIYTGGGTSFTYNKLEIASGYVNYQVISPRTVIGANGMASIYSNSEYFHVEKNVGDKMRIRLSGDVQINGTNY